MIVIFINTLHLIIVLLLTIFTQIGGVVYLLCFLISKKIKWFKISKLKTTVLFLIVYLTSTLFIVPKVAPIFGREQIVITQNIKPASFIINILNRNYIVPELNILLNKTALQLNNTGIDIKYLDANFPFIDDFPLWPHLSHNDGKKIDLSFVYEDENGVLINKTKSTTGYGVFEAPMKNEINQTEICKNKGYWFYDFTKYISMGTKNQHLKFSIKGNLLLLNALLAQNKIGKIFIEPHLKQRLKLRHQKIRFQGCKAVRHDDHIHLQL